MSTFFIVLTLIAMIAVLAALFAGLISMARGGEFNARYGNKLMRARVVLQGLAVLLLVAAALSA